MKRIVLICFGLLAAVCFLVFFLYDNQGFSQVYYAISLTDFIFGR